MVFRSKLERRKNVCKKISGIISSSFIIFIALTVSISTYADAEVTFESVKESYEEEKIYNVTKEKAGEKECEIIYCEDMISAETNTESNIRKGPDISTEIIGTLKKGTKVNIWGAGDNGWLKVYCKNPDGTNLFGYMWGGLLDKI